MTAAIAFWSQEHVWSSLPIVRPELPQQFEVLAADVLVATNSICDIWFAL